MARKIKRKTEIITLGPNVHFKKSVIKFKEKHPIWYIEEGKIKSSKPTDLSIKEFMKGFKKTYKKVIKQMSIRKIKII